MSKSFSYIRKCFVHPVKFVRYGTHVQSRCFLNISACRFDTDSSLTSKQIRKMFIDYFVENHKHVYVQSSSTIPRNDPTLYFVNAGMNQFKPIFQGMVNPQSDFAKLTRAVNSQKCIRAGGKHNDLDDVGRDTYHHTFFEMLGSWSFGDYFKRNAIEMAWDLLTRVYKVPRERLYITYFGGSKELNLEPDKECQNIWLDIGIPSERILPCGMKDNFWEMGEVGPCGPCTEIHFDRIGGRDASSFVNTNDPDVVELWNIVFMQFNREQSGELKVLPQQHVDTGMGLERIVSVIQKKKSNYDTDMFMPYFDAIQKATGIRPYSGKVGTEDKDKIDMAYRIVADHIRTLTVAICDGCRPGEKRWERTLQQITRRGIYWCNEKLMGKPGLFANLVHVVVNTLGDTYPEIKKKYKLVIDMINEREKLFLNLIAELRRELESLDSSISCIPGDVAWRLYSDKFSIDLIMLMAEERNLTIDWNGFELAKQRAQISRRARGTVKDRINLDVHTVDELRKQGVPSTNDKPKYHYTSDDQGNNFFENCEGTVLALRCNGEYVDEIHNGELAGVLLDTTGFYAELGGQVCDEGVIARIGDQETQFSVTDVQLYDDYVLHVGAIKGNLRVGDRVICSIDRDRRENIMKSHTGLHALNFAFKKVVGKADQRGSLVAPNRLQLDYSAKRALSVEQVREIEAVVDGIINANMPVFSQEVSLSLAKSVKGITNCSHEVYSDPANLVTIGVPVDKVIQDPTGSWESENSVENCSGIHVRSAGHIKAFTIVRDKALSQGRRRIVALTGNEAIKSLRYAQDLEITVDSFCSDINKGLENGSHTFDNATKQIEHLWREISNAVISPWRKSNMKTTLKTLRNCPKARELAKELICGLTNTNTIGIIVDVVDVDGRHKDLDYILGQLKSLSPNLVAMLFSVDEDSNHLVCCCQVPNALVCRGFTADHWISSVSTILEGECSGGKTFAECSGGDTGKLPKALEAAKQYASTVLSKDIL